MVFGKGTRSQHGILRFNAFFALVRYVRDENLSVLYICGLRASLWLRLVKPFMPGVKLVHAIRTNIETSSLFDRIFRLVERWLNGLVDLYIANSQIAAATLVERCYVSRDKIKVIYNGIEEMPLNIPPLYQRPLNILTVANLVPYKGYLQYLSVIEKVLEEIPEVNFTFIGRDDMNGEVQLEICKRDLNESITYVGFQEDISSWMKATRLLVVPSLKEGCPTSVLEAMSYGVPVVGYSVGGLPELVRHMQDGLLVPVSDMKGLADAIVKLLREPELASKMASSSLARCETEFQLKNCALKHRKAFISL